MARAVTRNQTAGEKISRAALELFATKGYDATGIREIGALAGVSSSVLYHYVESKEAVLRELALDGLERHHRASRLAVDSVSDPAQRLAALISVQVAVPVLHPSMSSLLEQGVDVRRWSGRLGVQDLRDNTLAVWTEVLTAGREAHVFDISTLAVVRSALLRSTTLVNQWYRPDGALSLPELITDFVDFGLAAVRAHDEHGPLRAADLPGSRPDDIIAIVERAHVDAWW